MVEVIWTERATEEITSIAEYLEQYSALYASGIVKKLYGKEGNYRIMYEMLDDELILIQRVMHASRYFKEL